MWYIKHSYTTLYSTHTFQCLNAPGSGNRQKSNLSVQCTLHIEAEYKLQMLSKLIFNLAIHYSPQKNLIVEKGKASGYKLILVLSFGFQKYMPIITVKSKKCSKQTKTEYCNLPFYLFHVNTSTWWVYMLATYYRSSFFGLSKSWEK